MLFSISMRYKLGTLIDLMEQLSRFVLGFLLLKYGFFFSLRALLTY